MEKLLDQRPDMITIGMSIAILSTVAAQWSNFHYEPSTVYLTRVEPELLVLCYDYSRKNSRPLFGVFSWDKAGELVALEDCIEDRDPGILLRERRSDIFNLKQLDMNLKQLGMK